MQCEDLVTSYAKLCYVVYAWLFIVVLRRWLPQGVIDSHYVIMLTNVHTHSHIMHAYIVVKGHGV